MIFLNSIDFFQLYEKIGREINRELPVFYKYMVKPKWKFLSLMIYFISHQVILAIYFGINNNILFQLSIQFIIFISLILISRIARNILADLLGILGISRRTNYLRLSLIFKDKKSYNRFLHIDGFNVIYPKHDTRYGLLIGLIAYLLLLRIISNIAISNSIDEFLYNYFNFYGYYVFPITHVQQIIYQIIFLYFWLVIISALLFILRIIFMMRNLHNYVESFSINETIRFLNRLRIGDISYKDLMPEDKWQELVERGHYSIFLRVADSVSSFLAKISIIIISFAILYNSIMIIGSFIFTLNPIWYSFMILFGILIIVIGVIFFITPQFLFYRMLKNYKTGILNILQVLYEKNFLSYTLTKDDQLKEVLIKENREIETAIEYARKLRVIPFSTNNIIKLGGIILVWLQTSLLQLVKLLFAI